MVDGAQCHAVLDFVGTTRLMPPDVCSLEGKISRADLQIEITYSATVLVGLNDGEPKARLPRAECLARLQEKPKLIQ